MSDRLVTHGYQGNPNLKAAGIDFKWGKRQIKEYMKCSEDPIYFIKKYVKIINVDEGLIPFEMWNFQEKMIRNLHNNRFVISKFPRQTGKSTVVIAYFLYMVLFTPDRSIAILANKGRLARELLGRLMLAYEHLPLFLQQGIKTWNKGDIELENGSKIIASTTSSSAVRGGSYNCVAGESLITLRHRRSGKVVELPISLAFDRLANSSRKTRNDKYEYECNEQQIQQIQEVVLFTDVDGGRAAGTAFRGRDNRKTSQDSFFSRGCESENELSSFDNTRTSFSSSVASEISEGKGEGKDDVCLSYDVDYEAREVGFGAETRTTTSIEGDFIIAKRKKAEQGNQEKNVDREFGETKNQRTCKEHFVGSFWSKEIERTFKQDQQKSREDSKDCRSASGNETKFRRKEENERISKEKNTSSRRGMEQGNETSEWEICTSVGFKSFHGFRRTRKQRVLRITTASGKSLITTYGHKFCTSVGDVPAQELSTTSKLVTTNGYDVVVSLERCAEQIDVYDALHVEDVHSYYANEISGKNCIFLDEFAHIPKHIADDFFSSVYPTISSGHTTKVFIVSTPFGINHFYKMWTQAEEGRSAYITQSVHWSEVPGRDEEWKRLTISNTSEEQFRREFECEFIGSSNTLISGDVLQTMVFVNPVLSNEHLDVYVHSVEKHTYVLVADCAHGVESDYSTFSVVDVSTIPYVLVAKYRHNKIPPMLFPSVIENVARKYNDAYVLIEVNDIGSQVAGILHNDLEYDNMMFCAMRGRAGQVLGGGFSKATILGVKTTKQVKRVGCANLKTYIESNKLLIQDFDMIAELTAFIGKPDGSFAAEAGNNDDLVMTLVLFSWLSVQPYFKEMVAHDFRTHLQKDRLAHSEESLCPFGMIDDGIEDNTYVDPGGTMWHVSPDETPSEEDEDRKMWGLN